MNVKRGAVSRIHTNDIAQDKIKAGQVVTQHPLHKWRLVPAIANDDYTRSVRGIALHDADLNDAVEVVHSGDVEFSESLFNPGWVYCVSQTEPGKIVPFTELVAGKFCVVLGVAKSARVLTLNIQDSGVLLSHAPRVAYMAPPEKKADVKPAVAEADSKPKTKSALKVESKKND